MDCPIVFLDPENPILDSEITLLRALDQKLWWETCFGVMAENVSFSHTLRVRVAQNIFTQLLSLSTIYLVVKFEAVLIIRKRTRPVNVQSDLEPAQVKVVRHGQIF